MIRHENHFGSPNHRRGGTSRATLIAIALGGVALLSVGLNVYLLSHRASPPVTAPASGDASPIKLLTTASLPITNPPPASVAASPTIKPPAANPPTTAASANLSASELVTNLATIDLAHGPLSSEKAAAWKQSLRLLAAKGQEAIPAIRDFLAGKQDVTFDVSGAAELLGVPSLRLALLAALEEIGGMEAVGVAKSTLQAATDPVELAVLARFLDHAEPRTHRAEIIRAAQSTLARAASGNWDGRDVAPLFEIMRTFGSPADVAALEPYANQWFNYTPITLAHWPDGAGVPLLIKLAQNSSGAVTIGQEVYERMLVELALDWPAAADAFVELVRADKIEVTAWPALSRALAGNTLHIAKPLLSPPSPLVSRPGTRSYHLAFGNQNFLEASLPDDASAKMLNDRLQFLNRVLEVAASAPAKEALVDAHTALSARLSKAR